MERAIQNWQVVPLMWPVEVLQLSLLSRLDRFMSVRMTGTFVRGEFPSMD